MSNLNNLYDQATQEPHFDLLNESAKEALLNFLETLEELLPALYELHKWKDPDYEKVINEVTFSNKH